MKKILLSLSLGLVSVAGFSQTIVYQEDFNVSDGGWTEDSGTNWDWGVPSAPLINYDDSPCGENAWVTNLTGDYSNSEYATLTSPTINCSSLGTDPVVAFDLFYDTENGWDETWMEYSLDDGATWTKLTDGGSAIGWYNDLTNEWWEGSNGDWTFVSNVIPGAAGVSTVKVRFILSTDGIVTYEGIGIDNIVVADEIVSATMNGVTNISSGVPLTSSENIEVSITNNGSSPLASFDVCYTVNGGAPVCETVVGPIATGTSTYTFTATEDFSVDGTYEIQAYISGIVGDISACDDSSTTIANLISPISAFPFVDGFEDGTSAFIPEGNWEIGSPTPGSDFDNTLACPDDNDVLGTKINASYDNSITDYVYSPIFDFSGLVSDPYVVFDLFRNTESCCDEAWMDVSIDGGTTWTKVGTSGSGLNWYNDAGNQWWDGTSGGWVYAYNQVSGVAGEANVQFRFVISSDGSVTYSGIAIDNFTVQENAPSIVDGTPLSLDVFNYTLCGFTDNDILTAEFINNGIDSIIGFDVCYDLGAGFVCETLTDTIIPGGIYTHDFATGVDLTGATSHDITLVISNGADVRACNDTAVFNLSSTITHVNANASITDISCNGAADGEVFVNPMDGTPGYSVAWDSGDMGFVLSDLDAGFHTYTVTDANGCTYVDSAEVIEPAAIALTTTVVDETVTGNGEIDLTVTGGTAPYTFDWDNDGTGDYDAEDLTGLTEGVYTVVVTDANGCTETTTASLNSLVSVDNKGNILFEVYPNPAIENFTISVNEAGKFNVTIYNVLGDVVYVENLNASKSTISTANFESGTYFVTVSSEESTSTLRLIVK